MEIGDGNAVGGPGSGELLREMQKAHDEAAERVESGDGFRDADAAAETDRTDPESADGIEGRVLETARRVLDGEFDSPEAVRDRVVETIVEERYGGMVGGADGDAMGEAVKDSLTDDVAFRQEVDRMLMHAARELGRSDAE